MEAYPLADVSLSGVAAVYWTGSRAVGVFQPAQWGGGAQWSMEVRDDRISKFDGGA